MKLEKEIIIYTVSCHKVSENKENTCMDICFKEPLNKKEVSKLINIKNNKKVKLTLEVEEPILDEVERKYLSSVIRPFRDKVKCIIKYESYDHKNKEYISIFINDSLTIALPYFKKGSMYKNMELNKEYTLEDLQL